MQPCLPEFNTGDIILYNTTKHWYSRLIERFTHSDYSHVSIVLHRPTWLDESLCKEEYYVLESGKETFPDAVSGDFKFGVQVCPLSKVWAEYMNGDYGHLYVRRIRFSSDDANAAADGKRAMMEGIKTAYSKTKSCPYDLNPIDWIKCYFDESKTLEQIDESGQRVQKTTSFWCSALLSFILVAGGFLDKTVPWTVITPYDFSAFCKQRRLTFKGCDFDTDVKLC